MARQLRVYVDGFNLYHGIHDVFGRSQLWLDLVALSKSLRPRSILEHVTYFTANAGEIGVGDWDELCAEIDAAAQTSARETENYYGDFD